jgi:hypothetical protein
VRFTIDQQFAAPAERVVAAFADPALYATYPDRGSLAPPTVLTCEQDGARVTLQIQHRFTGHVSAAVRAVVDPNRLSWVEHVTFDLDQLTGTYRIQPDHYPDRLRCQGTHRFLTSGDGSRRVVEGELKVRAPLVAGTVERAIASGLQDHLRDEVGFVTAFLAAG